jgi:hypothetical protein
MPMTPREFFENFVCADYEDWEKEQMSIRLAFHASVSAFHLRCAAVSFRAALKIFCACLTV